MRGTYSDLISGPIPYRFIPACAGNIFAPFTFDFGSPVHPRVCGEHQGLLLLLYFTPGSSPRVRGTSDLYLASAVITRFIPACAGNISRHYPLCNRLPVHPRVCGEHFYQVNKVCVCHGSSPRVRGTYIAVTRETAGLRFIPACAGNIIQSRSNRNSRTVHPRVCGEHFFGRNNPEERTGSSPRVRGTSSVSRSGAFTGRFIPACAGNILLVHLR